MDDNSLERLQENLPRVKLANHYDKVYKDECMFSFDTPFSAGGLYTNLSTLQSFGEEFVQLDWKERTRFPLYYYQKWTKVPIEDETKERAPEKMAIGVEGGFQVDKEKFYVEKEEKICIFPNRIVDRSIQSNPDKIWITLPCDLPLRLEQAIGSIQKHDSVSRQQVTTAWEEEKMESKHALSLEQLSTGKIVSMDPSTWYCEESGMRENLWLNLSTGYIGSGRPFYDGSGGTGAALRHYEETGRKYPLVVKLGTITPSGADVYSYDPEEDCAVLDPLLEEHLLHWGIDMKKMEKTEKTMNEMEVDLNLKFEFNKITEASSELIPVYGPGYIGLKNLGNSCYMNAVVQILWMVPAVRTKYLSNPMSIFRTAPGDPADDFLTQMTKLGVALVHARTGLDPRNDDDAWSIRPLGFKMLVGKGDPDFSSSLQQDSHHYFTHLLEVMDLAEIGSADRLPSEQAAARTSENFFFQLEERLYCEEANTVSYITAKALILELDIPLESATNKNDVAAYKDRQMKRQKLQESGADAEIIVEQSANGTQKISELKKDTADEKILPKVPFEACLCKYIGDTILEDVDSELLGRKTSVVKSTKIKTFPPFLMVQLKRYYVNERWEPAKLEVLVEAPEEIDLEFMRAQGPQPGEVVLKDKEESGPVADAELVSHLTSMGFTEEQSKMAAIAVNNSSLQQAIDWIVDHGDSPPEPPKADSGVDRDNINGLKMMGFSEEAAQAALIENKNDMGASVEWLIANVDQQEILVKEILARERLKSGPTEFLDGKGVYELVGFLSHMGSSVQCGHYVCHIKKKGRWILFNDEKVAISESPPKEFGYMYLYKRKDVGGVIE